MSTRYLPEVPEDAKALPREIDIGLDGCRWIFVIHGKYCGRDTFHDNLCSEHYTAIRIMKAAALSASRDTVP